MRDQGRNVARALGVVAAVGLVAGCGGGKAPLPTVVGAARLTLSATASTKVELSGATAFGTAASAFGQGAWTFSSHIGYVAVDIPATETRPAGRAFLVYAPTQIEFASRASLPTGKNVIAVPLTPAVEASYPTLVAQLQGLDTQLLLEELVFGATSAISQGSKVVAQIPLHEYSVVVDLRRALKRVTGPRATPFRIAIANELDAMSGGRHTIAMIVWVDGPGHIGRLSSEVPGSGFGTVTASLASFGNPLAHTSVPAANVIDIRAVPEAAGGKTQSPLAALALGSP